MFMRDDLIKDAFRRTVHFPSSIRHDYKTGMFSCKTDDLKVLTAWVNSQYEEFKKSFSNEEIDFRVPIDANTLNIEYLQRELFESYNEARFNFDKCSDDAQSYISSHTQSALYGWHLKATSVEMDIDRQIAELEAKIQLLKQEKYLRKGFIEN